MQKIAFTYNDTFNYLKQVSDVAALNPGDCEIYEAELMKARDYYAVIKTAKKKSLEESRAEGRAEGLAKVVRNMIAKGLDLESIANFTGLSIEEVIDLK